MMNSLKTLAEPFAAVGLAAPFMMLFGLVVLTMWVSRNGAELGWYRGCGRPMPQ